jgi:hypothetical protein
MPDGKLDALRHCRPLAGLDEPALTAIGRLGDLVRLRDGQSLHRPLGLTHAALITSGELLAEYQDGTVAIHSAGDSVGLDPQAPALNCVTPLTSVSLLIGRRPDIRAATAHTAHPSPEHQPAVTRAPAARTRYRIAPT